MIVRDTWWNMYQDELQFLQNQAIPKIEITNIFWILALNHEN